MYDANASYEVNMNYKSIPGTDLRSSAICLGGGAIGLENAEKFCYELLDRYIGLGGNYIDSANWYGKTLPAHENVSDKILGSWMKKRGNRNNIIVGTKGGHPAYDSLDVQRLTKKDVSADLEESLRALQIDCIDIFWVHRDDRNIPVPVILEYLNDFVKEGKISYFGCSNWKADRIKEAHEYSVSHGIHGFIGNQMMWSYATPNDAAYIDKTMVGMDEETRMLHLELNLAAMPYAPQARGFFEKINSDDFETKHQISKAQYYNNENLKKVEKVNRLSKELNLTPTEIILGYLLSQKFVTIPIIGCDNLEQLEASMKAGDVVLDENTMRYLEEG